MRILITGGSGRLGRELLEDRCWDNFDEFPNILSPSHIELDITDLAITKKYVNHHRPHVIIHAAAMTDVRRCEVQWQKAELVNIVGTKNIISANERVKAKIIYISTACVFDGTSGPYAENRKPSPKNFYSLTKYAGEKIVGEDNLIIRTNFVPFEPWKYEFAFTDRIGTYLFAHDVARAIPTVLFKRGTVHVCGDKEFSMYDLAKLTTPDVKPMTIKDYNGPPLTMDMRLISNTIKPFKLTMRDKSW